MIGFWRRLYRIIRANFNHYRYARLDRIAAKKALIPQVVRDNSPGAIIRYSGKPPMFLPIQKSPRQIADERRRRMVLMAENKRRVLTDYSPYQNRITDEMVEEDHE